MGLVRFGPPVDLADNGKAQPKAETLCLRPAKLRRKNQRPGQTPPFVVF